MVMNVVFFTQNGSLNNLWRGYFSDDDVKFTHNKKDFFAKLNDEVDIVGIDTNTFKDSLDENIKTIHENFPNIKFPITKYIDSVVRYCQSKPSFKWNSIAV